MRISSMHDLLVKNSKKWNWEPTSVVEVYLYIGILLYMEIYREKMIALYWEDSFSDWNALYHFLQFMSYDCFELLHYQL